jgi:glyoxylase-like metal-dependent hydrolase (beta-lactamase superfamily II)
MALGHDVLVTLPPRAVLPDGSSVRPVPAWSPISSTLIHGDRDAILVDAPHTIERAREVADWVVASGRNLTAMYATHGHADHWLGFGEVAKRFPDAAILGTEATVAAAQLAATERMGYWTGQFPGQIVEDVIVPSAIDDHTFDLEGHAIHFVEAGHSDTEDTTFVHVPELGLVVAGDIVYNGVHLYLVEGDAQGRRDWIAGIDQIAALNPRAVIAGHKAPGTDDGPHQLDETRRYLEDAEEISGVARNAKEFADLMTLRHLSRVNPNMLFLSAEALFAGTTVA